MFNLLPRTLNNWVTVKKTEPDGKETVPKEFEGKEFYIVNLSREDDKKFKDFIYRHKFLGIETGDKITDTEMKGRRYALFIEMATWYISKVVKDWRGENIPVKCVLDEKGFIDDKSLELLTQNDDEVIVMFLYFSSVLEMTEKEKKS